MVRLNVQTRVTSASPESLPPGVRVRQIVRFPKPQIWEVVLVLVLFSMS